MKINLISKEYLNKPGVISVLSALPQKQTPTSQGTDTVYFWLYRTTFTLGALLPVVTGGPKLMEMLPSCNAATAAGQVAESREEFAKATMTSSGGK